jgi:hypothetical protein
MPVKKQAFFFLYTKLKYLYKAFVAIFNLFIFILPVKE